MAGLSPSVVASGYELTPELWAEIIYTPLQAASALLSLPGVQSHYGYGPIHLPKMSAEDVGDDAWVAPTGLIPLINLDTGERQLLERGVKAMKVIALLSDETLRSSVGDVVDAGHQAIINSMVRRLDPALIQGSSAAGITGFIPQAGATIAHSRTFADGVTTNAVTTIQSTTAVFTAEDVGTTIVGAGIPANTTVVSITDPAHLVMSAAATATATGVSVTLTSPELLFDELTDALTLALDNWARPDSWLMNTRTMGSLYKLKDTLGRPLLTPNMHAPTMSAEDGAVAHDVLLGLPVYAAPSVPSGTAVLIDEDQVHVACDMDAALRLLDQTFAQNGQVGVLVDSRWDVGVVNPMGVIVVSGLGPAPTGS